MNFIRNVIIIAALINAHVLLSQRTTGQNIKQPIKFSTNIISSSTADSVLLKIEMLGAQYDASRKNLPYYLISKSTFYNQIAKPSLVVKRISIVNDSYALVIKKYFSKYLTQKFELLEKPGFSKSENFNHYKLFPFRLNGAGQIEELIEYSIDWRIIDNNSRTPTGVIRSKNSSV
jgi:hypothetical protein